MEKMKRAPLFITGTDTGVGKTVLTALLAAFLRQTGVRVAACKPVCSGSREDARLLVAALAGDLTLEEINPWHFRAPVAPLLAARRERHRVTLPEMVAHCRQLQKRGDVLLVEGAGGLLSPLGEQVDSRDLIKALRAKSIIVGLNQLGVINHVRLTLAALPAKARAKSMVVLMSPAKPDESTGTNHGLLVEFFASERIIALPWLGSKVDLAAALRDRRVRKGLRRLVH
jgi:dethiobiotin synthetase